VTRQPVDGPLRLRHVAERAIQLGRSVAGATAPNPAVGCVIESGGTIVGEGATAPAGGPHAEVQALRDAGPLAGGSCVVVTLEPCAHIGRTPPCTDALIAAGVGSVRYLVSDQNPMAAGGAAVLRAAGIDARSIMAVEPSLADLVVLAEQDLRGFMTLIALDRPNVLLKLAQLPDGRLSDPASAARYLTGPAARRRVHELRAQVDAVLVGSGTVISDDPRLDVRDTEALRQPRPVILATAGRLPLTAKVLTRDPIVLVGDQCVDEDVRRLTEVGAEVHRVVTIDTPEGPRIDPRAALELLPGLGILTVLAEPGASLARAMIAADVVDDVELHVAGIEPGAPFVPAIELMAERFRMVDVRAVGDDAIVRARRDHASTTVASLRRQAVA